MNEDQAITKTTVRHGRIFRVVSPTRVIVRWDDGAETEEALADLHPRGPTDWRTISDAARRRGERDPFEAWR